MSDNKNSPHEEGQLDTLDTNITSVEVSSVAGSVKTSRTSHLQSSSSERQIKFERAQKCLENAALVSKRIKEHRKATAELLGRPFEEYNIADTASEMASTMSEKTGYSAATDTSNTLSIQDALNIPGISESLANTLKQKELIMERIKLYKELSKRPIIKPTTVKRDSTVDTKSEIRKAGDGNDVSQLINTIKEKENALSVIQVKIKAMETTILDLQEKLNEKDQIIEAKNRATTLMSDSLSKKEKDTVILLEDTRQQMIKMQENFVAMEADWREEKQKLIKEIELKDQKILELEEANKILETARFDINVAYSKLNDELEAKNQEILKLQESIKSLSQVEPDVPSPKEKDDVEEEKGSLEITGMVELTKKIELLEQLNCQIRLTNKELESKLASGNMESKSPVVAGKKGSPLPTRKGGRNAAAKSKSPWSQLSSESLPQETDKKAAKTEIARLELLVQSLNKDILEKEYIISQKDALIFELKSLKVETTSLPNVDFVDIGVCTDTIEELIPSQSINYNLELNKQANVQSDDLELTNSPFVDIKELEEKLKVAQEEIFLLNNNIDIANKNMIKVKSNHKLKLKQMQKTIDNFSKISDANAEVVKLNEELHQLTQKVAELEEEKGNLQLHLVDYDSGRVTDSDIHKKLVEAESLAETRLKSISVLEAQKFDLVQELHVLQQKYIEMEDKLADISQLQNVHVCSEIKSVELEEHIDELVAYKKELELVIENLKLDKEQLNGAIKHLEDEKVEIMHKLENYIQENLELSDKLDKLSAEKVSSAESIEIVESLTTQEKLELEEYNKGIIEGKIDDKPDENVAFQSDKNIDSLIEQREDLNKKIELFTLERQEVMEKINKIGVDNELLVEEISKLNKQCSELKNNIDVLSNEKQELFNLNQELNHQIENLKRERMEIIKETADISKPMEEVSEGVLIESHHEDKAVGDKGNTRMKSVKQLTKDILKLKNIIKEREDEIADCQMKILSLEEQQQKQSELLQTNIFNENKIQSLMEENSQLKQELETVKKDEETEQQLLQFKRSNELLQQELQKINQEYSHTVSSRDNRISELEIALIQYEQQIFIYGNTIQEKDKEINDYINQITKLNDVSQKLKSTIELLEEEKAKDQNAELIKSLNKQISAYQMKLADNEETIKSLEEEKMQLRCLRNDLENKNDNLEIELKNLQEAFTENQALIKELQITQQKHSEELSAARNETIERDIEIHEIKLQLRKESIENETLRMSISEKELCINELTQQLEEIKEKLNQFSLDKNNSSDQFVALETKNIELMEKLKKFALSIKNKSAMYTDLQIQYDEIQKQINSKNEQIDQLLIQVETLPTLQEKLKLAEQEINRLQLQKLAMEQQKMQDIIQLQTEISSLNEKLAHSTDEITKLTDTLNILHKDLHFAREENVHLKSHLDALNKKIIEHEIELKNNTNLTTKISSLEADNNQMQIQITELQNKIEQKEHTQTQIQFGYDAKVQERDLYIENLETEIGKYKNRICRLEESVSAMEDRRYSLERKADQLGCQLQEKQKAYTEYTSQEDELVNRLAFLMDHDRVVEKQLLEIENENKELQYKVQHLTEANRRLKKSLSDIQEHYNILIDKASKLDSAESEITKYQIQLRDLETNQKKLLHDHQLLTIQKKKEIEEIETEFNTQIENAIKEKKALNEKYEKVNEYVSALEMKLQEYKTNIKTLDVNIEELTRINNKLTENSAKEKEVTPDYTEQYVNEINKLNYTLNSKSQEILELNLNMQAQQANYDTIISNLESKIMGLTEKLQNTYIEIERLSHETSLLKNKSEQLELLVSQRDEQIIELRGNKKMTFEMSIPKTEGMIISSTIEPLGDDSKGVDISSLESQIVSGSEQPSIESEHLAKNVSENLQEQSDHDQAIEDVIVPKKAYICNKNDDKDDIVANETDPFNSDEGWGFGDLEEATDITPGLSHLNEQIKDLKTKNEALKSDLNTSNIKLMKAMKKLKEFKSSNDMLSNELKLSKQMTESSFLDNAIEDELRSNIQALEKRIEELNGEIVKEKKDKDTLRKQNEVFYNANEKLTGMKEKLDNEIELWKYKFKVANDKLSTVQWGGDTKDLISHVENPVTPDHKNRLREELMKIEKENDELHVSVGQLSSQNKELLSQQTLFLNEITSLKHQIDELDKTKSEFLNENEALGKKLQEMEIRYNELLEVNEGIRQQFEIEKTKLIRENSKLTEEFQSLKELDSELKTKMSSNISEMESIKTKLLWYEQQQNATMQHSVDTLALAEKCEALEQNCLHLNQGLNETNNNIIKLENEKKELLDCNNQYQEKIADLTSKIQNLNIENDNLLSTVAELRSSVASAVDQRGFEIAELWKQHLAQREADFQKIESDLRNQLNMSEVKYEQLLENVQSSSQEETTKMVIAEQVSSLQNKLEDKEEHIRNLQNKYTEVMNQMCMLRSEMEDEKVAHDNKLLEQQEEYEKVIQEITVHNHTNSEDFNEKFKNVQIELAASKASYDELNQIAEDLQIKLKESNSKVTDLTNELHMKESEIYQKTHDYSIALTQRNEEFENVRKLLLDCEKKLEELSYEKESELAVLRLKMHENESHYEKLLKDIDAEKTILSDTLNAKIIECTNLNTQINDLNRELENYSTKISEMQAALENQEIEIVALKDEIISLQNELRSSSIKIQKHVSFASDTKPSSDFEQFEGTLNKELLDAVPRAELDLAFYMLHQRDVRCEELTIELTQLLEERDTLQLRLSDSLRMNEDLKKNIIAAGLDESVTSSQETVSELPTFTLEKEFVNTHRGQTSRSSSISDPDGDKPKLQAKLNELRSVKHSRDVLLRHESEQRQLDLRLLQRDVANLPPEAVSQLTQAHHTLSRDSQSTSTVLLNWLRGKSTPKVVDIATAAVTSIACICSELTAARDPDESTQCLRIETSHSELSAIVCEEI